MAKARRKRGIGIVASAEIIKGASNELTLAVVKDYFPDASTSIDCIKWYRSRLNKAGYNVPKSTEARLRPNAP